MSSENLGPLDPFTELSGTTVQIHELFESLVETGFTEAQALYLVGKMLAAATANTPPEV